MKQIRGGVITIECDSCDAEIESERGADYGSFWTEAKRAGWKTRPIGKGANQEWVHACPKHSV